MIEPARGAARRRIASAPRRPGVLARGGRAARSAATRCALLKDAGENFPAWLDAIRSADALDPLRELHLRRRRDRAGVPRRARGAGARPACASASSTTGSDRRARSRPRLLAAAAATRAPRCARSTRRASTARSAGSRATTASRSRSTAASAFVSGLCASADWLGRPGAGQGPVARHRRRDPRARRSPTSSARSRRSGPTSGEPLARRRADRPRVDRRRRARSRCGSSRRPGRGRADAARPAHRRDRARAALADRRLLRPDRRSTSQALRAAARDGVDVRLLRPRRERPPARLARSRAPATGRSSRRACACSSGTARCSTPRRRSPTAGGRASARRTSTSPASSGTTSSTSRSRTRAIAAEMERLYLDDLDNATEIVLKPRRPGSRKAVIRSAGDRPRRRLPRELRARGATAGVLRLSKAVGGALTRPRELDERRSAHDAARGGRARDPRRRRIRWPHVDRRGRCRCSWPGSPLSYFIRAWRGIEGAPP